MQHIYCATKTNHQHHHHLHVKLTGIVCLLQAKCRFCNVIQTTQLCTYVSLCSAFLCGNTFAASFLKIIDDICQISCIFIYSL